MSRLDKRKSRLEFTTSDVVREKGKWREVIIEAESGYVLNVRLKGLRTRFPISPARIYNHAVLIHVEQLRAEKKAKKKGNRAL